MNMKEFSVATHRRTQLVPITRQVQEAVDILGLKDGTATVFVPHTTAGITINENADPDVAVDVEQVMDTLVPWEGDYAHSEGNTAAHVKASLIGSSIQVLVRDGRVLLGTWQGIFLCEFDGPRHRSVWVG